MNLFLKRLLDVIAALAVLVIGFPFLLLISAAIKIDSKGPVLFRQLRLGKNGRAFQMLKFRTMVVNAEKIGTGLFSYKDDPRVTRFGALLRVRSLDELPQFYNVLVGDMSLVGPRPPVHYELGSYEELSLDYRRRFAVPQGITGLAQISGRNELSWDQKVKFDNEYIDLFAKRGILLDVEILWRTVRKVFAKHQVYETPPPVSGPGSVADSAQRAHELVIARATSKPQPVLEKDKIEHPSD